MNLQFTNQRRPILYKFGLRIFLCLLSVFCFSLQARSELIDSLTNISTKISGGYSDIIRQKTGHSSAMVFARSFDAAVSISRGKDSLVLAYSGWNQYASYNNYSTEVALSTNNGLRSFSLEWISSFRWINYSAQLLLPLSKKIFPAYYSAKIQLDPFDNIFMPEFYYERVPVTSGSGLGLKDFSFPLNNNCISNAWNIALNSSPAEIIEASASWGKRISVMQGLPVWYSSPFDWKNQVLSAGLKIRPEEKLSIWAEWNRSEEKGEMSFAKEGLEFGDLAYGQYTYYHWQAGVEGILFSLPFSVEYDFYKWNFYGVGHFEPWPFTTLASTVFGNRLYYKIFGDIRVQKIEAVTLFAKAKWIIKPSLGILYIRPNFLWRQWETDFLVFGIKNIKEYPLSTQQSWMLKLGCGVSFSLLDLNVRLKAEQYISVHTKDREKKSGAGEPDNTAAPGAPSSTDGGRWIYLEVIIP
ncbi:MAG: hypothetical protein JXA06_03695 [Bacteroidetes bacterium]|nr:hypothetical protein [Bacteroidota bacterium]